MAALDTLETYQRIFQPALEDLLHELRFLVRNEGEDDAESLALHR